MPKKKFALESDGPLRLEIKWKGGWFYIEGDAEVLFDGVSIGVIPHAELGDGKEFRLPDDSNLRVSFVDRKPRVFRDGKSLAEIDHPRALFTGAYLMIFVMAAVNVLYGLLGLAGLEIAKDLSTINSVILFVFGALFFLLGWWAKCKSRTAFVLSLLLYIVETVVLSIWDGHVSVSAFTGGIMVIFIMVQGITSVQKINNNQAVIQS